MTLTAATLSWIPTTLFVLAALPQAWTNLRLRSVAGLSMIMVFIRFSTLLLYLSYIMLCGLPIAYRIMMTLYTLTFSIVAVQGYRYSDDCTRHRLRLGYGAALGIVALGWLGSLWYAYEAGYVLGTIAVIVSTFIDLPQVIKNYQRKSTHGFSFYFASCIGLGAVIELGIALWFGLPMPTVVSAARATLYYLMFCGQFLVYGNGLRS